MFQWLELGWTLPSGIRVRVSSYMDWFIYNEIFVSREYDEALRLALDSRADPAAPVHIVDLGSSTGYFTLHAADQLRQRRIGAEGWTITAIDGDPCRIEEFRTRVFVENDLAENVKLIEGFVGERTGSATLAMPARAHARIALAKGQGEVGPRVSYVDLTPALAGIPQIDLLKCDIEGAELLLLQNYPDLLSKVRVAVFELHDELCDVGECRRLLSGYSFAHQSVVRESGDTSIVCVWR